MRIRKYLIITLAVSAQVCIAAERFPSDVKKFIDQRALCDHIRGEVPEPEDVERMKDVEAGILKHCTGTDKRLRALKRKYASNAAVLSHLSSYEPEIEEK